MDKSEEEAPAMARPASSRYESQKRRDWATFTRYLAAHRPPLELRRCSGAHVLEFLRHLDRFGKTRVHHPDCPSYGGAALSSTANTHFQQCQCPLQLAWGSLDALVGRLRAAFADNSRDASGININPFAARAVRLYLRGVRDAQSRARGISYAKKKKKKRPKKTKIRRGKLDDADAGCGKAAASASKTGAEDPAAAASCSAHKRKMTAAATTVQQVAAVPALEPLPPCLAGVPIECYYDVGLGGLGGGLYLPLLFNAFT